MNCLWICLRSIGGIFHAFYATLRNGMWDDPAEAVTGAIHQDFLKAVSTHGLPPASAIYLTWRYCYLKCFVLIGLVWAAASWSSWTPDRAWLDNFRNDLPQEIQQSRIETFIVIMSWWDPCLMYVWSCSFLTVLVAIFLAAPSRVLKHRNRHLSRYIVWVAWSWNFVIPFAVLLALPLRNTIDWPGLREDLCVVAVSRSMSSPGVDLNSAVNNLNQQALFSQRIEGMLDEQAQNKVTESSARHWCEEHPDDWHVIFCQEVTNCILTVDQRCRQEVCPSAPSEEFRQCQQQCLDYAQQSSSSSSQQFLDSLSQCGTGAGSVQVQAPALSLSAEEVSTCGDAAQRMQAMQMLFQQQESNVKDQCSYASMAIDRVDYVAGLMVGVLTGQLLLPSALSILGGLAESIFNIKVLFPGHREFPFLLVLTSFEAVPIYSALMAVAQQVIGDTTLLVTCAGFLAYIALPAFTGCWTCQLRTGSESRWQFYRKVWLEYALRALLGLVMLVSFSEYMRRTVGDRLMQANPLAIVSSMLLNYTRKTLTAVASTDAALSAFLQCEIWRQAFVEEDHAANQERIVSLGPILLRKPICTQDLPAVSDLQISKSKSLETGHPNGAGKGTNDTDLEDPDGSGAKHDKALLDSTLAMKSEKDQVDMMPASHPHGISPEKEPEEMEIQPALTTKVTM